MRGRIIKISIIIVGITLGVLGEVFGADIVSENYIRYSAYAVPLLVLLGFSRLEATSIKKGIEKIGKIDEDEEEDYEEFITDL